MGVTLLIFESQSEAKMYFELPQKLDASKFTYQAYVDFMGC